MKSERSATIKKPRFSGLHMVSKMKKAFAVLFVLLSLGSSAQAFAGNCQHPDDTAADGSRCGGRSADSRPGGQ